MLKHLKNFIITSDSHKREQMKLHPLTLSFADRKIENAFLEDYFDKSLGHVRLALIFGIFLYGIIGIVDLNFPPSKMKAHFLVRYVLVCPFMAGLVCFSFSARFKKYMHESLAATILIAGLGIAVMMLIDPEMDNSFTCTRLILVLMFGFAFMRCRFIWASVSGLIIVTAYEILTIFNHTPMSALANNSFHIITANIIGMSACYFMEYHTRSDFFSSFQLDRAKKEQEQRTQDMAWLNQLSFFLNKCSTEKDTYNALKIVCEKLFPFDSGYMMMMNTPETRLESVVRWGSFLTPPLSADFDECEIFLSGKKRFVQDADGEQFCFQSSLSSAHDDLCIPLNVQGKRLGVFHITLAGGEDGLSDDAQRTVKAKKALAERMVEQYALFLTNLRLRIRDPLTSLYNHTYIMESLENEIRQSENSGVVMFDIDDFRGFNEAHGNDVGDRLLRELGQFLKAGIRDRDVACRYGGGEFILILPELSLTKTGTRADQLRTAIAGDFRLNHGDEKLSVTASFGVAGFPVHGSDINKIITAVSRAMRRAKHGGRNRVVVL